MRKHWFLQKLDVKKYKKILQMVSDDDKEFFQSDGCGLEIEFGMQYERRCRYYIATGMRKIKAIVGNNGKFVPDMTIGNDLNVEIVLVPLMKEPLKKLFLEIKSVLDFYENFVFDSNCGIHANFRANDKLKRAFYSVLVNGGYDSSRFIHSKYKMDFMNIARKAKGELMTYDEYISFQNRVSAKYAGVNFLKDELVEFRTLNLNWDDIAYVYDLYEKAKQLSELHTVVPFPYHEVVPGFVS